MEATHIADYNKIDIQALQRDMEANEIALRIKDELLRECLEQDVLRPLLLAQNK